MLLPKFVVAILLVAVSHSIFSQKLAGDSWAHAKSSGSGVLTVIYSQQFGLIFKDKSGQVKGVCVDILSDFARFLKEQHGTTLTIKYAAEIPAFSEFLSAAQHTPNILGVTNTTITE